MNQHLGYVQSLNIRWVDGSISVKLDWNSTHFGTKKHLKQTQLSPLYPHCYIPINYVLIKGIPWNSQLSLVNTHNIPNLPSINIYILDPYSLYGHYPLNPHHSPCHSNDKNRPGPTWFPFGLLPSSPFSPGEAKGIANPLSSLNPKPFP
jgi:hypothetical protein